METTVVMPQRSHESTGRGPDVSGRIEALNELLADFGAVLEASAAARTHGLQRTLDRFVADGIRDAIMVLQREDMLGVLGVRLKEAALSRGLAWLLDPRGSHGLGDRFLGAFWEVVEQARSALQPGLAPLGPRPSDAPDVRLEVGGESSRIDIELRWRDAVLHVENKPFSGETGGDQTVREGEDLARIAGRLRVLTSRARGAFLTPSGAAGSNPEFIRLSYFDVVEALGTVLREVGGQESAAFVATMRAECRRVAIGQGSEGRR